MLQGSVSRFLSDLRSGLKPRLGHCVVLLGRVLKSRIHTPPCNVNKYGRLSGRCDESVAVSLQRTDLPSSGESQYSKLFPLTET